MAFTWLPLVLHLASRWTLPGIHEEGVESRVGLNEARHRGQICFDGLQRRRLGCGAVERVRVTPLLPEDLEETEIGQS